MLLAADCCMVLYSCSHEVELNEIYSTLVLIRTEVIRQVRKLKLELQAED